MNVFKIDLKNINIKIIIMSDYNFMKSGFNNVIEPNRISDEEKKNIEAMLALFISNATINAARYCELSGRNAVTKTDIEYGLKYEVFEYTNQDNLIDKVYEMNNELDEDDEDDYEDIDEMVVDDVDDFSRIINVDELKIEDKEFVTKMNHYYNIWNNWEPDTPILNILKNSINKIS